MDLHLASPTEMLTLRVTEKKIYRTRTLRSANRSKSTRQGPRFGFDVAERTVVHCRGPEDALRRLPAILDEPGFQVDKDKVGGWPIWYGAGPEYPPDPTTGEPMELLAMLTSDELEWGDGGNLLVFRGASGALSVRTVD